MTLIKKISRKRLVSFFSVLFLFILTGNLFSENPDVDMDLFRSIMQKVESMRSAESTLLEEQGKMLYARSPENMDEFAFWKKTYGARSRDPLFLIPARRFTLDPSGISAEFFFNMSNDLPIVPNMVFDLDAVEVLADFANPSQNEFLDEDAGDFERLMETLPYIRKLTLEERRIGILLSGGFHRKNFLFQIDLPLLFVERNYWLKSRQDMADLMAIIEKLKDVSTSSALRTKIGLGDTRVRAGYNIIKHCRLKSALGLEAILPTSEFFTDKPNRDLIITSKPGDDRKQLMTDLLNVGKEIMIDPKLGIGHWGLGAFWELICTVVRDKLDMWAKISFDYLFSGNEHRFLPSNKTISLLDFADLEIDGTIPADFPICDLFPYLANVHLEPGHIFNVTMGLNWYITKRWKFVTGYDLYYQQAEVIGDVDVDEIDPDTLVIGDLNVGGLVQHKLFGGIEYLKRGRHRDWIFGVGGDLTCSSHGAARDWTVQAKVGVTF